MSVIIPINTVDIDIDRCIKSLLSNYVLDLQIIIAVNSDDNNRLKKINVIIPNFPCIQVININKAGKSNAINKALQLVKNEYVLIGDADTIFVPDGLNSCVKRIYLDKSIVAITGVVEPISNNCLSALQEFEYARVFRVFRPFWNKYNANILISGCAGLFRTDALRKVGLYDCNTFGEDFEITLRLHEYYLKHELKYKIDYVNTTVSKTDVPKTFHELSRQRARWFAGQIEVLWKYRFILKYPKIYRKIIIPYITSVVLEVMSTIFKWIFLVAILRCYIVRNSSILYVLLISELCFVLFECLFNTIMFRHIKIKTAGAVKMTLRLITIQSILKDTNVIFGLPLIFKKNKSWYRRK